MAKILLLESKNGRYWPLSGMGSALQISLLSGVNRTCFCVRR
jgi:hypothetical protein